MTFGSTALRSAQRGVLAFERRLPQRDQLLVAQLVAQAGRPRRCSVSRVAKLSSSQRQAAEGELTGELQRVDSRLQAVARGVEPAAAAGRRT